MLTYTSCKYTSEIAFFQNFQRLYASYRKATLKHPWHAQFVTVMKTLLPLVSWLLVRKRVRTHWLEALLW